MTVQNAYLDEDDWDISPRREAEIMQTAPTSHQSFAEALEEARGVSQMTDPEDELAKFRSGRNVLTREEIDFLLRGDRPEAEPEAPQNITDKDIPDFYSDIDADDINGSTIQQMRDEVAAAMAEVDQKIEIDRFSQRCGGRLSLALRETTGLRAIATAKTATPIAFNEAIKAFEARDGWAYACFMGETGDVAGVLCLSAALVNRIVEAACGGGDVATDLRRSISPMDVALIEALMRPIGRDLLPGLVFSRVEIDQDFAAVLAGPVEGVQIALNVRIGAQDMSAQLMLAHPEIKRLSTLQPSAKPANASVAADAPAPINAPVMVSAPVAEQPTKAPPAVTTVMQARVASLRVPMSRIADLKPGSTLLLGVPADQPVELLTTGKGRPELVAEGTIGRKGNKMAIKITKCGPVLRRG